MQSENQQPQEIPQPVSQPTPIQSEPASIAPDSSKNRNFRKILLIFIIIIIIITTAGAGMLFLSLKNKPASLDNPVIQKIAEKLPIPKITMIPITPAPTTPPSQTSPQPSTQPEDIPSGPSNWKTYNNSSLNFSLSYPSELTPQENAHSMGITDISFTNLNSNPQNAIKYQILFLPKNVGKLIGQDFDKFYALPEQSIQRMTIDSTAPQQITKIKNITIDKLRAFDFRITTDPPDPAEEPEIGTCIEMGENIFLISTEESNKTSLDYMLSTFKSPL